MGKMLPGSKKNNFIDFLIIFHFIDFLSGLCLQVTSNQKSVGKIGSVKYFNSQLFQLTLVSNPKVIKDQDTYNYSEMRPCSGEVCLEGFLGLPELIGSTIGAILSPSVLSILLQLSRTILLTQSRSKFLNHCLECAVLETDQSSR